MSYQSGWSQPPYPGQPGGAQRPGYVNQWNQARPNWAPPNYGGQPHPQQLPYGYAPPNYPQQQMRVYNGQPPYGGRPPGRTNGFIKALVVTFLLLVAGLMLRGLLAYLSDTTTPREADPSFPSAPYQNEDYQAPPADLNPSELPMPETYEQATRWLEANDFYDATLAYPVRCEVAGVDASMSDAQIEERFNEFTACLMRVWAPALEAQGFEAVRPTVTVYTGSVNSACGKLEDYNAAYCAADQQVYYASNMLKLLPTDLQNAYYVPEVILAHEFGHAIQARTGIFYAEGVWEYNSNESVANNYSRRLEVQADCFAGQYVRTVATSVNIDQASYDRLTGVFYAIGDDVLSGEADIEGNHGHGDSRVMWFGRGASSSDVATCNTFIAPDSEVR